MPKPKNTVAYWKGLSDAKDDIITAKDSRIGELEDILDKIRAAAEGPFESKYGASSGFKYRDLISKVEGLYRLIDDFKQKEKEVAGTRSKALEFLQEENSKLWYFVRLQVGDKSLDQSDEPRPGEQYNQDAHQIERPFRQPRPLNY